MERKRLASLLLAVGLLLVGDTLFAHHGNASYSTDKPVMLKNATVTKFMWANPHVLTMFDVKDEKGEVAHWTVEAGSPSAMNQMGWTRNSMKPGDVITVYTFQSKYGDSVGRLNKIVLADGTVLRDSALGTDKGTQDSPTK